MKEWCWLGELAAAKHYFHYWDCLNSTAPNYREDLSKKRLVMSHSVETHCKLTDFLCKRDGESSSWVQCTPAWTFTMFEWLGEIPGGTIAVETEGEVFILFRNSRFEISIFSWSMINTPGVSILTSYGENPHVKLPIFSEFMENSTKLVKNSGLTASKSLKLKPT